MTYVQLFKKQIIFAISPGNRTEDLVSEKRNFFVKKLYELPKEGWR